MCSIKSPSKLSDQITRRLILGPAVIDRIAELNPSARMIDGFDEAIIGSWDGPNVLVYSFNGIISKLMELNECDLNDARDFYYFNIEGSLGAVDEGWPIVVFDDY